MGVIELWTPWGGGKNQTIGHFGQLVLELDFDNGTLSFSVRNLIEINPNKWEKFSEYKSY